MARKGRLMNVGSTKRPRQWPERTDNPPKFRAGVAGPHCICCRVNGLNQTDMKRLRRHSMRSREKAELRKEL